jgi:hypothetical protein
MQGMRRREPFAPSHLGTSEMLRGVGCILQLHGSCELSEPKYLPNPAQTCPPPP